MLYLGVDLSTLYLETTALCDGFVFLGEHGCHADDTHSLFLWIQSLLLGDEEEVFWFFCEHQYHTSNFPPPRFPPFGSHSLFLVKDRLVLSLQQACNSLFEGKRQIRAISLSYILAASSRLFDSKYIMEYFDAYEPSPRIT